MKQITITEATEGREYRTTRGRLVTYKGADPRSADRYRIKTDRGLEVSVDPTFVLIELEGSPEDRELVDVLVELEAATLKERLPELTDVQLELLADAVDDLVIATMIEEEVDRRSADEHDGDEDPQQSLEEPPAPPAHPVDDDAATEVAEAQAKADAFVAPPQLEELQEEPQRLPEGSMVSVFWIGAADGSNRRRGKLVRYTRNGDPVVKLVRADGELGSERTMKAADVELADDDDQVQAELDAQAAARASEREHNHLVAAKGPEGWNEDEPGDYNQRDWHRGPAHVYTADGSRWYGGTDKALGGDGSYTGHDDAEDAADAAQAAAVPFLRKMNADQLYELLTSDDSDEDLVAFWQQLTFEQHRKLANHKLAGTSSDELGALLEPYTLRLIHDPELGKRIKAAYSVDKLASVGSGTPKIRKPVTLDGELWVNLGGTTQGMAAYSEALLHQLVVGEQPVEAPGSYSGMVVTYGKTAYTITDRVIRVRYRSDQVKPTTLLVGEHVTLQVIGGPGWLDRPSYKALDAVRAELAEGSITWGEPPPADLLEPWVRGLLEQYDLELESFTIAAGDDDDDDTTMADTADVPAVDDDTDDTTATTTATDDDDDDLHTVATLQDLTSSLRSCRQTAKTVEQPELIRRAYALEKGAKARGSILDVLEKRHAKLDRKAPRLSEWDLVDEDLQLPGTAAAVEAVAEATTTATTTTPETEAETPEEPQPERTTTATTTTATGAGGGDDDDTVAPEDDPCAAAYPGVPDARCVKLRGHVEGGGDPIHDDGEGLQWEAPPANLAELPPSEQLPHVGIARGLELVQEVDDVEELQRMLSLPSGGHPAVMAAIEDKLKVIANPDAAVPDATPEELEEVAEATRPKFEIPDPLPPLAELQLVRRPDNTIDVWWNKPGGTAQLLGPTTHPRLATVAHQARKRANPEPKRPTPTPRPSLGVGARPEEPAAAAAYDVALGQLALGHLAAGLPALSRLGLEVEITIRTKPATKGEAQ